jgi:crotonobetainyl-CoA:carnitine CoA-transferase CaiB-like acyl-CoA transferase
MAEATMAMMGQHFMAYFADGSLPQRRGNRFTGTAPSNAYPCLGPDKWIAISVSSEAEWANLQRAMGNPGWATGRRFGSAAGRLANAHALDAAIATWTRDFDNLELAERLQRAGVPAVPSSDPEDLCRNPQFQARGALMVQESALEPGRMVPNLPWHFAGHPELDRTVPPAPMLGQDNRAVLEELTSATPDQIAAIERAAAAASAAPGRGGPPAVSARTHD